MKPFDIVAAMDRRCGIARGGGLPWHLPVDLAHFRRVTRTTASAARQNAVIMGRKTWESIPPRLRPLPGRRNVVVSRSTSLALPAGVLLAENLDQALERLAAPPVAETVEGIFVAGGGEIYALALPRPECRLLVLTRIDADFDCDTFFPELPGWFAKVEVLDEGHDNDLPYCIEVWKSHQH